MSSTDPLYPEHSPNDFTHPTLSKGVTKGGLLRSLGPGLITGAADDDPSGIATYSQVGAQFGFSMLWVMLFSYPLMCGIQEISGQIGRVTGRGIAGNLRLYYPPNVLFILVNLMLIANIINLGADIGAMGAAMKLLIGGSALIYAALFALGSAALETVMAYEKYAGVLKWMCAALFAYVATVFVVHVPWGAALRATVVPSLALNVAAVTSIVAVLGTTISPYLFFWQAQEEVEIEKANPKEHPLKQAPRQAQVQLHRIRVDTYAGMAFSNLVSFFIILTTAVTLHLHGITDIQTSTQAAEALRPIAGHFAFLLFSLGIIGTGLLALPVLAGSAAYAVGEALQWRVGLSKTFPHAKRFYAVIAVSMFIGLALDFFDLNPIKALFWSAVINGVVAAPIMFIMMLMGQSQKIMGQFTLGRRSRVLGWAATFVMGAAAIGLFATWGK
ncbi:MAG: divalent metal cation transporter [Capsulimonadaceae bacterium]|nr:divalent metal cation transporter [Capsulimonadaceae bacterium]